jgi:hypothetical protein
MKKKIIVLAILFLSVSSAYSWNPWSAAKRTFSSAEKAAFGLLSKAQDTKVGTATQGVVNYATHSSSTTKLNNAIAAFRGTYCTGKWAFGKKENNCDAQQAQYTQEFPMTDDPQVKQQAHAHDDEVAYLRSSAGLCDDEEDFRVKRLTHVARCLRRVFGEEVAGGPNASTPTIAICASGGGHRAMIGTLGMYEAFSRNDDEPDKPAFIDCVTYASCLSGSSWFTMPRAMGAPIQALKDGYKKYALIPGDVKALPSLKSNPLVRFQSKTYPEHFNFEGDDYYYSYFNEREATYANIMRLFLWRLPISMVTLYGEIIAHMTLSPFDDPAIHQKYEVRGYPKQSRQQMTLSQIKNYIGDGTTFPYPIGTMVSGISQKTARNQHTKDMHYIWGEASPYEVGFDYYHNGLLTGAYVPTWASGRKFGQKTSDGKGNVSWTTAWWSRNSDTQYGSKNFAPELTAGTFLGIFGSAFAVSVGDLVRMTFKTNPGAGGVQGAVGTIIDLVSKMPSTGILGQVVPGKDTRLLPAELPNYGVKPGSPFAGQDYCTWVDAGIAGNLPFWPLLKQDRHVDIIIAFDLSSNAAQGSGALLAAEKLARTRNAPFPIVGQSPEYAKRNRQWVTVFDQYPEGQSGPIVINLSLIDYPDGKGPDGFSLEKCFYDGDKNCDTFNFRYSPENVDGLAALGKTIAQSAMPQIRAAVQKSIHGKTKRTRRHGYLGTQLKRLKTKLFGRSS